MRPVEIQTIGEELAIRWSDGSEGFLRLDHLRRCCPCAACQGEVDVMGRVHRLPSAPLSQLSSQLKRLDWVGGYALQPTWGDGHSSGLYSFDYLARLAKASSASP